MRAILGSAKKAGKSFGSVHQDGDPTPTLHPLRCAPGAFGIFFVQAAPGFDGNENGEGARQPLPMSIPKDLSVLI